MRPDGVSNPGPVNFESGAIPTALRGPAVHYKGKRLWHYVLRFNTVLVSSYR